jgi:4-carboxymuconolactone decarboxylase
MTTGPDLPLQLGSQGLRPDAGPARPAGAERTLIGHVSLTPSSSQEAVMDDTGRYYPRLYRDLRGDHPGIAAAYEALGQACREAGPLSERDQHLVKLGIAIGLSSEGGVRSHVRRGLAEGLTREELVHAIAIAVPTAGFPATAAAYRWAHEVLDVPETPVVD